jgi:dihydroxyacetone kinase-like protein
MTVHKAQIVTWLENAAVLLEENKHYLTELDSAIGDADHGTNMARGFQAITTKLPTVADKDIGAILKMVAMTLMSTVGGASGLLYGNFFMKTAALTSGKQELSNAELLQLLEEGTAGIIQRGRAELGDKTMIDAWAPAIQTLKLALAAGKATPVAMQACVTAAEQGMQATIPMQARKGRASYLGERSIGCQDPGATSTVLLLQALCNARAYKDDT